MGPKLTVWGIYLGILRIENLCSPLGYIFKNSCFTVQNWDLVIYRRKSLQKDYSNYISVIFKAQNIRFWLTVRLTYSFHPYLLASKSLEFPHQGHFLSWKDLGNMNYRYFHLLHSLKGASLYFLSLWPHSLIKKMILSFESRWLLEYKCLLV